jgi:magnesium transporter
MGLFSILRKTPPGSPPGTLVINRESPRPEIRVMDYNAERFDERILASPPDVIPYLTDGVASITWIDVHGLGDELVLRELGSIFDIHPLVLEDVVHVGQRAKMEDFESHKFIVGRMVEVGSRGEVETEQLSLILGRTFVLTFQEFPGDCFDPIRERLRKSKGLIRRRGADFLAYSLIDATIDHYFPVLETFGERLEELETEVVCDPRPWTINRIHRVKTDMLTLRRAIWPMRDVVNSLIRDESDLIGTEARVHLRDCGDHTFQVIDTLETYRELASGLLDTYMSSMANRTNDVMKVLTIVSTIFIPLTFIAGVYGMNFEPSAGPLSMPELKWKYGYLACLLVMGSIAATMLTVFWRVGWLSRRSDEDQAPSGGVPK